MIRSLPPKHKSTATHRAHALFTSRVGFFCRPLCSGSTFSAVWGTARSSSSSVQLTRGRSEVISDFCAFTQMALPAPCAHQSSEDRAQSSNACTGTSARSTFRAFRSSGWGSNAATGTSPRLPELSSSFSEAAVCSCSVCFQYGFINYKNSNSLFTIQIGK